MFQRSLLPPHGPRGLDPTSPAMRLWQRAKELGVWDPCAVDLTRDRTDWARLAADERDLLLRLTALFLGGEEAVTRDLLPLVEVIADQGRVEETLFLTAFLFEEAKHVEAFHRFVAEVAGGDGDLGRFLGDGYRAVFADALPAAMGRLRVDASPVALAEAAVTYNMVVEGVLAETGYHGYHEVLARRDLMPGMRELLFLIKRDESRHIAFGVHLLTRLVGEHGDEVWHAIEQRMNALLPAALAIVHELFSAYREIPFGLDPEAFAAYAVRQFSSRVATVERARSRPGRASSAGLQPPADEVL